MRLLAVALLVGCVSNLNAQQSADERAVRGLIENFHESSQETTNDGFPFQVPTPDQ